MTLNPASIPPDGRHRYAIRVYYETLTRGGVVYHANYLRYAERARTEALRDLGVPHAEMVDRFGVMFMVRGLEVDYERGARLDEALAVETEVLEVGGATVRLRQTVRDKDGVCATRWPQRPVGVRASGRKQTWPHPTLVAGTADGHAKQPRVRVARRCMPSWPGSCGPPVAAGCLDQVAGTSGTMTVIRCAGRSPTKSGRGPGHGGQEWAEGHRTWIRQ